MKYGHPWKLESSLGDIKKNPKRYDSLEYEVNIGLHVLMEPLTLFRENILTLSELVMWCLKQPSFA
jgi:hypothetical protein